jgi:hypothetical protein
MVSRFLCLLFFAYLCNKPLTTEQLMPIFRRLDSPERVRLFQKAAFGLDMKYLGNDKEEILPLLRGFRLFSMGGGKKIFNLISKTDAWLRSGVNIFDYQYVISTGKSSHTFRQTVFFVNSKMLGLPEFYMKPENFLMRLGRYIGIDDIDFERFPEFSRQYWLKGDDEDYLRYTMNDDVLQFFTLEKGWHMEAVNYYFVLYKHNVVFHPNSIASFYRTGMRVFDLMKSEKESE